MFENSVIDFGYSLVLAKCILLHKLFIRPVRVNSSGRKEKMSAKKKSSKDLEELANKFKILESILEEMLKKTSNETTFKELVEKLDVI